MERITQFYTPKNKKKTQSQLDAREKKKKFRLWWIFPSLRMRRINQGHFCLVIFLFHTFPLYLCEKRFWLSISRDVTFITRCVESFSDDNGLIIDVACLTLHRSASCRGPGRSLPIHCRARRSFEMRARFVQGEVRERFVKKFEEQFTTTEPISHKKKI